MTALLENGTLGKNQRFEERTECKRLSPGYEPGPAFSLYYFIGEETTYPDSFWSADTFTKL